MLASLMSLIPLDPKGEGAMCNPIGGGTTREVALPSSPRVAIKLTNIAPKTLCSHDGTRLFFSAPSICLPEGLMLRAR